MSGNLNKILYDEIKSCKSLDRCYGKTSRRICPVAFRQGKTRIMVITEQSLEDDRVLKKWIKEKNFP